MESIRKKLYETTLHEIMHIIAFNSDLYKMWINRDGQPHTTVTVN